MITSTSTQAEVLGVYADNIDWDGDVAKAKLALSAVRWLVVNRIQSVRTESGRQMSYESLLDEKKALEAFLTTADPARRASQTSFVQGRMRL